MTRIKYVGPLAAVEIAATGQVVKRDEIAEVDTAVATRLLAQADWKAGPAKKGDDK